MTDDFDPTVGGIARAAISECDRLGDPPTMMVSGTSLRMLAEAYLRLESLAQQDTGKPWPSQEANRG
jgi:hypothetical protein